ncbi:hypothetical protein [Planctomicrobium piriforme]|uniref:Soil-associated protein, TIGR03435 family n=1 Tax=Planctomicrobium piriforme TaxID=1576369 RepID=A0A1I3F1V3_9PLAN|nr:hypothetical protein [Planctomicrobium piriforme]SFI05158.1 hypothetical protein SAMN05421753_10542 [Planctomicrobium piriforme]
MSGKRVSSWRMSCVAMLVVVGVVSHLEAADAPATAASAAKVIDLAALPLMPDAQTPGARSLAQLTYVAPASVKAAFTFHQQQLTKLNWKEEPGGYVTDQFASGTFTRDGFQVALTVSPGSKPHEATVMLINLGNVDLTKVPAPPGAKPLYVGAATAMYLTDESVDAAKASVRKTLEQQGWTPYGESGPQHFFRQNAMRLGAMVDSAPAQMGKTSISYTAALMSVELPVLPNAEQVHYADVTKTVDFSTAAKPQEVDQFYRTALASAGWKPTSDKLLKIDDRDTTIFRNDAGDMLTMSISSDGNMQRVQVQQQSAAEVAEFERKAKAAAEAYVAKNKAMPGKVTLTLPKAAKKVETNKSRVEFQLPAGQSSRAVDEIRQALVTAGWTVSEKIQETHFGTFSLSSGQQSISIVYVDSGLTPGEVTISGIGTEFDVK